MSFARVAVADSLSCDPRMALQADRKRIMTQNALMEEGKNPRDAQRENEREGKGFSSGFIQFISELSHRG